MKAGENSDATASMASLLIIVSVKWDNYQSSQYFMTLYRHGGNLQRGQCTAADSCHCWIKLTLRSAEQVCWAARSERSGFS